MKSYFNGILIGTIFLFIFPLLEMPTLWRNIYVLIFAFSIAYLTLQIRKKYELTHKDEDDDTLSLQEYVKELKEKMSHHKRDKEKNHL